LLAFDGCGDAQTQRADTLVKLVHGTPTSGLFEGERLVPVRREATIRYFLALPQRHQPVYWLGYQMVEGLPFVHHVVGAELGWAAAC